MKMQNARKGLLSGLLATCLLGMPAASNAEDIDLFLGPSNEEADEFVPNVLFVLDNTANWNSIFDAQKAALQEVFESLPTGKIRIGVLMYSESGGTNKGLDGGYIRAAIRAMNDAEGSKVSTKQLYSDMIGAFDSLGDRSNSGKSAKAMAEAYFYFAAKAPKAGSQKAKTDYDGNVFASASAASKAVWALDPTDYGPNALAGFNTTPYNSPAVEGSCAGNYIIFIGNGPAQDSNSDNTAAAGWLQTELGGVAPVQINLATAQASGNWADEWAKFMKESNLAITTYTVDINRTPNTGQGPNWTLLLRSMANVSGGKYYDLRGTDAFDAQDLVDTLDDILSRILAVDSVFASVALPAAASAQSTFLNQVYVGVFRPDGDAAPRWPGNLKQYKLGRDGAALRVLDADDAPIVDGESGFVTQCARSFWTDVVAGRQPYWAFLVTEGDQCLVGGSSADYDTPDGPNVEKGGQASMLRKIDPADRNVLTCSSTFTACDTTGDSLTAFEPAGSFPTAADLGVVAGDRDEYINWAIGFDLDDENENGSTADMRAYVHGDVVHSQPVAIDYNAVAPGPQVVVFYAGNDGMLRAINGERTAAFGTSPAVPAGAEIWSFVPPEFFPSLKLLRDNDEVVRFPASGANAGIGISKPYGMDGPLTSYQGDANNDGTIDQRWLFAGMRRGGRVLYAFDVTNVTAPSLKWKKGCDAAGTCVDTDYANIGQTWSPATVTFAEGYDNGDSPLLVMGGGYDDCEDFDNDSGSPSKNHDCASATDGDVIYVIDADDGSVVKTFATDRAVPGKITVVPYDPNNDDFTIKYAYATDTGGNIYRIHGGTADDPEPIGSTVPDSWVMTKIASLGCANIDSTSPSVPTCTDNRKFLFGPDVAEDPENPGRFAIVVGSGDREKPLLDYGSAAAVNNYFFSVIDRPIADWTDDDADGTCGVDMVCMNALTSLDLDGVNALGEGEELSPKGWKFALATNEQVVSGALTLASVTNFSTHIARPDDLDPETCQPQLGVATTYNLDYLSATGEANNIIGGGLVPTPVGGYVELDDGTVVPFCIGCGGEGSAIGSDEQSAGSAWTQPKNRVYWNIKK